MAKARVSLPGILHLVSNKGAGGLEPFPRAADCRDFALTVANVQDSLPIDLRAMALIRDELLLLVRPETPEHLGQWMRRVLTSHAMRFRRQVGGEGAVWQGRFRAIAVQDGPAKSMALRVLRATVVESGESLALPRYWQDTDVRSDGALAKPAELRIVRHSIKHGIPLGDPDWMAMIAEMMGLVPAKRPGRPKSRTLSTLHASLVPADSDT